MCTISSISIRACHPLASPFARTSHSALSASALILTAAPSFIPHPKDGCEKKVCKKWATYLIRLQILGSALALIPLGRALQKGIPWEKKAYFDQIVIPIFSIGSTLFISSQLHDKPEERCRLKVLKQASSATFIGIFSYSISDWTEYSIFFLGVLNLWKGVEYCYAYRKDRDMEEGINTRTDKIAPTLVGLAGASFLRSLLIGKTLQARILLRGEMPLCSLFHNR